VAVAEDGGAVGGGVRRGHRHRVGRQISAGDDGGAPQSS
jgi:hypothetical protein